MTHIVLGACIGEAFLAKKIGKRALLLGAAAQSIPDIDFVASLWNDPTSNLLAHRGFTHSLLFAVVFALFFSLLMEHYFRFYKVRYARWLWFFTAELGTHLFVDLFNSYGMGLCEPFSHQRFSFNALFVADPLFSLGPALAFFILLLIHTKDKRRNFWKWLGIGWSSFYLLYCVTNKITIESSTKMILSRQHIVYTRYLTTPTPFNNWLWYIVAEDNRGFYTGYRSVFDKTDSIFFHYFPRNDYLLGQIKDHAEVQKLQRFSQGFYTVEKRGDRLVFNDLRFGQIAGWFDSSAPFVFHFYLQRPANDNQLVLQRGRFTGWNKKVIDCLMVKIKGR